MKIAFIHEGSKPYGPSTALETPIGGTQAASGYLSAALAQNNHQIFLITPRQDHIVDQGVVCHGPGQLSTDFLTSLDAVILVQSFDPGFLWSLNDMLPETTPIILWTGQAYDQPGLSGLHDPGNVSLLDQIWCVSDWQRQGFLGHFPIEPHKIDILRNAIAPVFESIAQQPRAPTSKPVRAYYASTPFRGLSVLLDVWEKSPLPGCQLQIFGGMAQYGQSDTPYIDLYARAGAHAQCHIIGATAHQQLAHALADQDLLLYPSIFAETSCIAALEALATGALPIVTDLGALPETLNDFAMYVPFDQDYQQLAHAYGTTMLHLATAWPDMNHTTRMINQKQWVLDHATWAHRAITAADLIKKDL